MLILVLLLGTAALPLLAGPASGYGEHVYEANPVLGPTDPYLEVYAGQTLAQSFTATATHSVLNVTLRLRNVGSSTNTITIGIHSDDPVNHTPVATSLATAVIGTLDTAPASNVSVVFSPSPTLTQGRVYWIVAANAASARTSGYRWSHSGADTYAGGHAELFNASMGTWAALGTDLYFVNYGRDLVALLTAGMAADRNPAQPDDLVNFTLFYNNSGTQASPKAWINDTLPSSLTFVSDTSPVGSRQAVSPSLAYVLTNVSNGPHSFRVTLRVNVGTSPGTVATNRVNLSFVSGTGAAQAAAPAQASVTIGLAVKELYLAQTPGPPPYWLTTARPTGVTPATSADIGRGSGITYGLLPNLAGPFRASSATATFWVNSGSGSARFLNVNASVLDDGLLVGYRWQSVTTSGAGPASMAFAFPIANYTFAAGHAVQLRVFNDPGSDESLVVLSNATGTPSALHFTTTTYVGVTSISLQDASGPATYWSPLDSLVVEANVSDPFGSGAIAGAWLNATAPSGTRTSAFATSAAAVDPSSPSAWKRFRVSLGPPLENGTYRILVTGLEDNGVRGLAEAQATVRAPAFTFAKTASVLQAKAADRFAYRVWFNNTGTGPAGRVWVNDTLPAPLVLDSSNSTPPGVYTGAYNWTWSNVGPGTHELLINVSVPAAASQVAWIRNRATLSFADEKGHAWAGLSATVDVVINGPSVGLTLSSAPASRVHTNETVVYTVNLTNAGDTAQTIWLNDTMPSGFAFVGSTASAYGGTAAVAGNEILFQFGTMPSGSSWSFTFTLRAGTGMPLGAAYTNTLGLNATSLSSVLMPPKIAWTVLSSSFPVLGAGVIDLLAVQAGPAETIPVTLSYSNTGSEAAPVAWLNLTLEGALALTDAAQPFTYSPPSVVFALANVSLGVYRIFLNVTVSPSAPDRIVAAVRGTLAYADAIGNLLPMVTLAQDQVTVSSPALVLSVSPGNVTIEAGTSLTYTVYLSNSGSGTASDAWLNMTLASAFGFLGDSSNVSRSNAGANYSWHWTGLGPGSRAFSIYLSVRPTTPDNTLTNVAFRLDYQDANRIPKPSITTIAAAKVIAPAVLMDLSADRSEALAGDTLTYVLQVRNVGETSARWVSLTDAVDDRLEVLTFTSTVPATGVQTLTWNVTDLSPGQSEWINLTVRVRPGVSAQTQIAAVFEARYSNSLGGLPLGYVRSSPVTLRILADSVALVWMTVGAGAVATALGWVLLRRRVAIEEVFLVYRDGVLISHLSRSLIPDKDEDVLSGMLTAVQEFVRDAFRYGQHRELHQMDFGEYRILIERGKYAYLAVVYSGTNSGFVGRRVRTVLNRIETTYGAVLESWDGDMDQVVGARDLIRDHLLKPNGHPRVSANGP